MNQTNQRKALHPMSINKSDPMFPPEIDQINEIDQTDQQVVSEPASPWAQSDTIKAIRSTLEVHLR
jgi:hypothetical protein